MARSTKKAPASRSQPSAPKKNKANIKKQKNMFLSKLNHHLQLKSQKKTRIKKTRMMKKALRLKLTTTMKREVVMMRMGKETVRTKG